MTPFVLLVIGLAFSYLKRSFERMAEDIWDDLWEFVFQQVAKVEAELSMPEAGAKRKVAVLDTVTAWVEDRFSINFIQRIVLRYLVSKVIDALVDELNETMGHDWLATAQEAKEKLEERWPFLKPGPYETAN